MPDCHKRGRIHWFGLLKKESQIVEQITKADRNACHAICEMANPAPRYGGLVPPFYDSKMLWIDILGTDLYQTFIRIITIDYGRP